MEQPATVQLPPPNATPSQQAPPPRPQQQQMQQAPNPQQFVVYGMQPYAVSPLQQQQHQQIVAMQPVPATGAFQPGARFNTAAAPPQLYPQQMHPAQGVFIGGAAHGSQSARRPYKIKSARALGSLQIIMAFSSVVLGIVALIVQTKGAFVGAPIWVGIFIRACMGMSIVSSVFAGGVLFYAITAAVKEGHPIERWMDNYSYDYYDPEVGKRVLDATVALNALVECVVAIVQAAYCCHGVCGASGQNGMVTGQNYAPPVRYVAQPNQSMQPVAGYPVGYPVAAPQQQQQQPIIMQAHQQPRVNYRQKVVAVQSAPVSIGASENAATSHGDGNEPTLPVYTDSPPPSYSLSTGHM